MDARALPPLAVALGDPAGVGPEVVAKSWEARERRRLPCFFAVGDERALSVIWRGPIVRIGTPAEATAIFPNALPLIQVDDPGDIIPGEPNTPGARCALDSLELAAGLARSGAAGAVVTAPVSKAQLYSIGFTHDGQTEFVAERCGIAGGNVAMMMVGPSLRTVPLTIHTPIAQVPGLLTIELIVSRVRTVNRGLQRDFGITCPRLAIAGLNPHAGENGNMGTEEVEIIRPAIEMLRAEGIDANGPFSADTLFDPYARKGYDAAICMYHDQALIPLKTLHFDDGVNMTLGLPIVRTAPDHGTAFALAGRNAARGDAMIAAIALAGECASRRLQACV
ncbi:4-hydroxythreonine-4-phosphate dehydrogenase PdxA [Tardibacter chloracetimidivorans]|uniref:4-hydroxythreonine-4-phosphate dehydrogenase PdxA n=1 Tax=Tardibacter chloracetimidivorans TaxID=1921510 RepID=UPI0009FAE368|nr:4-hydroxythreonine-4-phosphate dehydrogenase PdxA [Tardibacter chloracetimidivorans]